ncbi:hypothetical protein AB9K41_27900, partial [Cribrihabitans sp. XS_ASV171]
MTSLIESDPVAVRLSNVGPTSFDIRLQEPGNEDGTHAFETVSWLVLEAGTWELPDGLRFEVGHFNSARLSSSGFDTETFTEGFLSGAPMLNSQVQTENGPDWVITRQRDTTAVGGEIAMQEEEALNDGFHASERIGWLAMERGTGLWDGLAYEADVTGAAVGDNLTARNFQQGFSAAPALVTSLASFNGSDPAGARVSSVSPGDFVVKSEEETSADTETTHLPERVGFLAIEGSGILTAHDAPGGIAEVGSVSLDSAGQTIQLSRAFLAPVVVAFVATENGFQPVNVRVSEVRGGSLTMHLQEPNYLDGTHFNETVNYLVVEEGSWVLPDGTLLEAGRLQSNLLSSQGFESVAFDAEFDSAPVILSQVQSANGPDFVTTRQRGADAEGFQLTMQEEEAGNAGSHFVESLGWVALEAGSGTSGGVNWVAGSAAEVTDANATVPLGAAIAGGANVIAGVASYAGSDPAWARGNG